MNRIVHLGLGNFHRAHQAWYTAKAGGWMITGVIMTNTGLRDDMRAHANRYALGQWGAEGLTAEVLDIYDNVLLATEDSTSIIAKIADPETHIVTLTVTEKGYYLKGQGAGLDLEAPAIRTDLKRKEPRSAIGLLCRGLETRFHEGAQPITLMSCDNLSGNGDQLERAVRDFMTQRCPGALDWLTDTVSFPNTMVDRITPRLSDDATKEIQTACGIPDLPVVGTESFSEWVIEDDFRGPRPSWETAGAAIVHSVGPFEDRKLRLLNAAHSYLAYAGLLKGHSFVHEAVSDPALRRHVEALWDEATETITAPASNDISAYRQALLERFSVPDMRHALAQIAMDGSLKLKERLLPIIAARQTKGRQSPAAEAVLIAWAEYVCSAKTKQGSLVDPHASTLMSLAQQQDPVEKLIGFLRG